MQKKQWNVNIGNKKETWISFQVFFILLYIYLVLSSLIPFNTGCLKEPLSFGIYFTVHTKVASIQTASSFFNPLGTFLIGGLLAFLYFY